MTPPLPEWAPHQAVWIGFPSDPELWLGDLKPAEREIAAFAQAVHAGGKGEQVWLVAAHEGAAESARALCPFAHVIVEPFGDIWLRDTGPIVRRQRQEPPRAGLRLQRLGRQVRPRGRPGHRRTPRGAGRPALHEIRLGPRGRRDRARRLRHGDHHRAVPAQPQPQPADARGDRARLDRDLGFERVIWLGSGLLNDHTDGHIDNLARFIAPGRIASLSPPRTIPTRQFTATPRGGCARPGSTSSPCPRPVGSPAKTAT